MQDDSVTEQFCELDVNLNDLGAIESFDDDGKLAVRDVKNLTELKDGHDRNTIARNNRARAIVQLRS